MHCRRVPACHLRNTRGSQSSASCGMHRPVPPQLYHSWSALSRNMKPRKVVTCTLASCCIDAMATSQRKSHACPTSLW